ncbi:MAG: hypothetical protein RM021_008735 [Nostoc sp. EkiNYC01]|nr:hypothetical protein [Nostoc sp. EkiNYC01]
MTDLWRLEVVCNTPYIILDLRFEILDWDAPGWAYLVISCAVKDLSLRP